MPMADGNLREVSALFWVDLSQFFEKVEGCLGRSARVCLSFCSPYPYPLTFFYASGEALWGMGVWKRNMGGVFCFIWGGMGVSVQ